MHFRVNHEFYFNDFINIFQKNGTYKMCKNNNQHIALRYSNESAHQLHKIFVDLQSQKIILHCGLVSRNIVSITN